MKKLLFVYNPRSGKGLVRTCLADILNIFTEGGYEVTVHPTQAPRDGHDCIKAYAKNFDLVVVSGGDGTLSEAVNALMALNEKIPLGYIPAGSTNDFAVSMGISKDMLTAAADIVNGAYFEYDIGKFGAGNYFTYVAAFGMFTDVSYETPQETKNIFGHAAYIVEGIRRLRYYRGIDLTIEHDGIVEKGNFIVGLVSNSRSIGGMAIPALERAYFDDGLFEVSLVRTPNNALIASDMVNCIILNKIDPKYFLVFRTSKVRFISSEGVSWTLDGEAGGTHTDISIECMKRAVKLVIRDGEKVEQQIEIDEMTEKYAPLSQNVDYEKNILLEDQNGIEN